MSDNAGNGILVAEIYRSQIDMSDNAGNGILVAEIYPSQINTLSIQHSPIATKVTSSLLLSDVFDALCDKVSESLVVCRCFYLFPLVMPRHDDHFDISDFDTKIIRFT